MRNCALLTCESLVGNILDEDRLEQALEKQGWSYQWIPWKTENVNWNQFDAALIRTTWDYFADRDFFLSQLKKIEDSTCRLFNPYPLVEWNSDKSYLTDLSSKNIATIPTHWISGFEDKEIEMCFENWNCEKLVVKPAVGAGAKNTFKITPEFKSKTPIHQCYAPDEVLMVQPFMEKILLEGEHSAHFFGGEFSHMVLKTPKENDFRSQEEFGSYVRKLEISSGDLRFCQKVLDTLDSQWLYARVDFINDSEGSPTLIELELIEPSLYFRYDEESASRLVTALNGFF